MHALCLVLVTVFAGQACHGYQGPSYTLGRGPSGSTRAEQAGLRKYPGHRKHDANHLRKLNKEIKNKSFSDEDGELQPAAGVLHNPAARPPVRTDSHTPEGLPTIKASSFPVPLTASKPSAAPRRLLHSPARDGGGKDTTTPWPYIRPSYSFHFPIDLDKGKLLFPVDLDKGKPHVPIDLDDWKPCKNKPPGLVDNVPTAPPHVCDFCPSENGMNPLDPCTVRMAARTTQCKALVPGSVVRCIVVLHFLHSLQDSAGEFRKA